MEIHKKFSIPFACLVFGLFALPLGINNRRGGKASGFALSIGVLILYYILLSNGEEAARFGKLPPWLAMWAAEHPARRRRLLPARRGGTATRACCSAASTAGCGRTSGAASCCLRGRRSGGRSARSGRAR